MIENAMWFLAGLVAGSVFHAPLKDKSAQAWSWLKARAAKYGIGRGPG